MNDHLSDDQISSFVGGEATPEQRLIASAHLDGCARCRARGDSIQNAIALLKDLPSPELTGAEQSRIRSAISESVGARKGLRGGWGFPRIAALTGAAALILVGLIFAVGNLRRPGELGSRAAKPVGEPPSELINDFQDPSTLRDSVLSDDRIKDARDAYHVRDVGARQRALVSSLASAANPQAASEEQSPERSSPSSEGGEGGEGGEGAEGGAPALDDASTGLGIEECMNSVIDSQPYPMMPLEARAVTFQEKAGYLLVFAWTDKQEAEALLDKLQIWVVARADCSPLNQQVVL